MEKKVHHAWVYLLRQQKQQHLSIYFLVSPVIDAACDQSDFG